MARASVPTLLSLDRYAQIMNIAGAHFNQGVSSIVFPLGNACSDIWYQWSWQHADSVSREELAEAIANAEQDIADELGWWPAPTWIAQDAKMVPRFHRPDYWERAARNVRGARKSIEAQYGKIIAPGQRQLDPIGTAEAQGVPCSLTYSDEEPDTFSETVTVECAGVTQTTDVCEVKVYFSGHNGDPEWEIRPARTKTLTGGTFTATFWAWQFIDPDYWETLPTVTTETPSVDLDTGVYVDSVEIYREYNDTTATHCTFYWEPEPPSSGVTCAVCLGTGCPACQLTTQDGCMHIRDAQRGVVVPAPATYDATDAQWEGDAWTVCRDPDQITLYYYCGDLSWRNLRGDLCEPLSDRWARVIADMATARLDRPICTCGNLTGRVERLQTDLAYVGRESGAYNVPWSLMDNPFGTRVGEVEAWRFVSRLVRGRQRGATAL